MKYVIASDIAATAGAVLLYPIMQSGILVGYNIYDNSPEDQALIAALIAEHTPEPGPPPPVPYAAIAADNSNVIAREHLKDNIEVVEALSATLPDGPQKDAVVAVVTKANR